MYSTGPDMNVVHMSNRYTDVANASKSTNRVGASHLTSVLNACQIGKSVTGVGYDETDILMNASGAVGEANLSDIPFIDLLGDILQKLSPAEFKLGILSQITPNIGSNTMLIDPQQQPVADNMMYTNDVADIAIVSKQATIASMVADASSGMLMENLLTSVSFMATNMTVDGMVAHTVLSFNSVIKDIDKTALVDRFITKFVNVIMPQITEGNQLGVEVAVSIDIMGEARISVVLNNEQPIVYSIPTYADSLFTSVVSDAQTHTRSMSEYTALVNMVTN